jgi:hypothetical protein
MEQTSVSPYVLVSTPRINTLLVGAPRLSDQSDRVFILGVETSIALIYLFQRHNILTRPLNALRGLLRHCSRSCFIAAPPLLAENVSWFNSAVTLRLLPSKSRSSPLSCRCLFRGRRSAEISATIWQFSVSRASTKEKVPEPQNERIAKIENRHGAGKKPSWSGRSDWKEIIDWRLHANQRTSGSGGRAQYSSVQWVISGGAATPTDTMFWVS